MFLLTKIAREFSYHSGFSIKDFRKYKDYYAIKKQMREKYSQSLLIRTMQKSGSHFLISCLGNYINLEYNPSHTNKRIDYPTLRNKIYTGKKINKNNEFYFFNNTGYQSFIFDHDFDLNFKECFNSKSVINLYRNPLDFFTSMYYFDYKNRLKTTRNKKRFETYKEVNSVVDMASCLIDRYIYSYKLTKRNQCHANVINICYEELVKDPKKTMHKILNHLHLSINIDHINTAINMSKLENMAKDEKKNKVINLIGHDMNKPFIRSGKIGEWKEHFSQDDVEMVFHIFKKNKISVDDFILE